MNHYPAQHNGSSGGGGPQGGGFNSQPPNRPHMPPGPAPYNQQQQASIDYPPYPPPPIPARQTGPPPPIPRAPPPMPQGDQAGPSGYMNRTAERAQPYRANGGGARPPPGAPGQYGEPDGRGGYLPGPGSGPSYDSGRASYSQPPPRAQNGSAYSPEQNRNQSSYPALPPIHFTDRPPPPPFYDRSDDRYQGFSGSVNGYAAQDRDRPRQNFTTKSERPGRGRSPEPRCEAGLVTGRYTPIHSSRFHFFGSSPLLVRDPHQVDPPTGQAETPEQPTTEPSSNANAGLSSSGTSVQYEADIDGLRASFDRYGQIKTYFDLVKQRGMIFITYLIAVQFDLRAAERARDGMHDTLIKDRRIDVHYSLPRKDDQKHPPDKDSNQGSVVATLLRGPYLTIDEVGRMANEYGDIKTVRPGRSPEQVVVEYYDARGAIRFIDMRNGRPYNNGTLELLLIWDETEQAGPPPLPISIGRDQGQNGSNQSGRHGPNGGREGRGRRNSRVDRGGRDGPDGRRHGGPPVPGGYRDGPHDGRGRSPDRGPDRRGSGGSFQGGPRGPPGPPQGLSQGRYNDAPPQTNGDDRLERARQVQDLLASLSGAVPAAPNSAYPPQNGSYQPHNGGPPPLAPPAPRPSDPRLNNRNQPPPQHAGGPGAPQYNAPPAASYVAPPPISYGGPPSQHSYDYPAPSAAPPGGGGGGGISDGIPPEVRSLLQANKVLHHHPYVPPANPRIPPPSSPYRAAHALPMSPTGPPPPSQGYGNGQPYQQNQQHQEGYQPAAGGDVGSLLAILIARSRSIESWRDGGRVWIAIPTRHIHMQQLYHHATVGRPMSEP
ncbi:uncharacterized protein MKK02DRAFT_33502 [Dioszegia hungarica]|uniref:RRM domain-containing protein n=1 Tax=Dioszegia hungarica TaxID=4972 RepID=A0AA38H883_9TREE|nr:uncharacterized protein MKK02DRAFT_33502 [Dioszegia hungarica]KAI9636272.1 hypothetical protein MKK02DRAFT_33502 [Dioszegia hungarica]